MSFKSFTKKIKQNYNIYFNCTGIYKSEKQIGFLLINSLNDMIGDCSKGNICPLNKMSDFHKLFDSIRKNGGRFGVRALGGDLDFNLSMLNECFVNIYAKQYQFSNECIKDVYLGVFKKEIINFKKVLDENLKIAKYNESIRLINIIKSCRKTAIESQRLFELYHKKQSRGQFVR